MTYVSVTKTVDVDVDVDLSDIDTDDLETELESRGVGDVRGSDSDDIPRIFEALYVGNEQLALEITRKFVQDATGRLLP
jgi:hypothetical protein